MSPENHNTKRNLAHTPGAGTEKTGSGAGEPVFVVQKHYATHLHYDFRLEVDGVLKSWAVPKGPSMDPHDKRLAVMVEDHPLVYAAFEGIIPEGDYGAGTVEIWDKGTYTPAAEHSDMAKALDEGLLEFTLHGKKLRGAFALVHTHMDGKDKNWLLIKKKD